MLNNRIFYLKLTGCFRKTNLEFQLLRVLQMFRQEYNLCQHLIVINRINYFFVYSRAVENLSAFQTIYVSLGSKFDKYMLPVPLIPVVRLNILQLFSIISCIVFIMIVMHNFQYSVFPSSNISLHLGCICTRVDVSRMDSSTF